MENVITTENRPIKLWVSNPDEKTLEQARNLANLPFAFKHIALMPDAHAGYGMPIGGVMATKGVVVPNAVGVDIGCGMCAIQTELEGFSDTELKKIVEKIKETVPVGFNSHEKEQEWGGFYNAPDIPVVIRHLKRARHQIGTLGGGNHFIEIQKDDESGKVWVMIHSGSRNFGKQIADEYHKKAKELCQRYHSDIPTMDLAFLPIETDEAKEYMEAMDFALDYARANRGRMLRMVMDILKIPPPFYINIHHNYAAWESHFNQNVIVHRKGATKATDGDLGIIPGSQGTCSYIVMGLGNSESFKSCSHGAGRAMGRKEAERKLNLEEQQDKMKGIIHSINSESDLDEAPDAYKDIDEVMQNQADLVEIVHKLRPLAVIKG